MLLGRVTIDSWRVRLEFSTRVMSDSDVPSAERTTSHQVLVHTCKSALYGKREMNGLGYMPAICLKLKLFSLLTFIAGLEQ